MSKNWTRNAFDVVSKDNIISLKATNELNRERASDLSITVVGEQSPQVKGSVLPYPFAQTVSTASEKWTIIG